MKDIFNLVLAAFRDATSKEFPDQDKRHLHHARSRTWINSLHEQFVEQYRDFSDIKVFSKYHKENRTDFGLNELLYDISVCRIGITTSARRQKELVFINEALWQVESEFAKNSRETLKDFSKLVLGSAKNKLFISSQVSDNNTFIQVLLPAAAACSGNIYLGLLPHPSAWGMGGEMNPLMWTYQEKEWKPYKEAPWGTMAAI